jgi:3-deoxy-7-phosphoheptulonate synthase
LPVRGYDPLITPDLLINELRTTTESEKIVLAAREEVISIVGGIDANNRLLVIVGPCSIHDPAAALDYCDRLVVLKKKDKDDLLIIMRPYLEKPRTTVA